MKDIRGQAKREKEYYASNPLQQCVVCGRWFCRRRDNVCARELSGQTTGGPDFDPGEGVRNRSQSRSL